jgi:DNA-directed RNA polymerase specialized sigma24 family protein
MEERDEDREWIRQSLEGDAAAFEAVVRKYQRMIHALTYRMSGSLADAEDLAQETFIRAYRQREVFFVAVPDRHQHLSQLAEEPATAGTLAARVGRGPDGYRR